MAEDSMQNPKTRHSGEGRNPVFHIVPRAVKAVFWALSHCVVPEYCLDSGLRRHDGCCLCLELSKDQ